MVDLYELTACKNVYLEEEGARIDIDELDLQFNKDIGWTYFAKIGDVWYNINNAGDGYKIMIE